MMEIQTRPWKILLVEDDEDDFILARAWLSISKGSQFILEWANTYEKALEAITCLNGLDAVLIDYDLGVHNGVELVKEMKTRGCSFPAILLTGRGSYDVDLEAMKAGADDYIAKNEVTPLLLERTIRYAIERKQIEEALRRSNEELELRVQIRTKELRETYKELIDSEVRLSTVVNNAPVILWAVDCDGTITLAEGKAVGEYNWSPDQMVGRSIFKYVQGSEDAKQSIEKGLQGGGGGFFKISSGGRVYENHFSTQFGNNGEVTGLIGVSTDITEQVLAQERLAHQAHLLEHVNDAVIASDANLKITSWNPAAENIYGWTAAEVVGNSNLTQWTCPDATELAALVKESGFFEREVEQFHKDGTPIQVEVKVTALLDENDQPTGFVSVNRDITERKRIQAELEEVRKRLMERIESERLELSQEIHDGPMQELYALVYQFQALLDSSTDKPHWKETTETAQATLEKVIRELRMTAYTLRPPALAPFGLQKAIQSHSEQYLSIHPGLKVNLSLQPDQQIFSEEMRLALFRTYQMAMTNIVRHARATAVNVRFHFDEESIVLEVQDDGVGFEANRRWIDLAREGHLGLIGASERIESIGGWLEVQSAPGKGTMVRAVVPRKGRKKG